MASTPPLVIVTASSPTVATSSSTPSTTQQHQNNNNNNNNNGLGASPTTAAAAAAITPSATSPLIPFPVVPASATAAPAPPLASPLQSPGGSSNPAGLAFAAMRGRVQSIGSAVSKRTSRVFDNNDLAAPLDEGLQEGPVFRATIDELERGALVMRGKVKQVLKSFEALLSNDKLLSTSQSEFLVSLRGLESMKPAVTYLEKFFGQLEELKLTFHNQMQSLVVEPLEKIYENDLQSMELQKKTFDNHSNEYNAHLEKYLSTVRDSKETKLRRTDEKFLQRRAAYNLVRFDYLTFLEELHTRKEQEVLYYVSSFADKGSQHVVKSSKIVEQLKPDLDQLSLSVAESWTEINNWIKERQDLRKVIEKSSHTAADKMINMTAEAHKTSISKFRGIRDLVQNDSEKSHVQTKQGFLYTKQSGWREWRKVWVVIDDGIFHEYPNWKPDSKLKTGTSIDLRTCAAKEAFKSERRFCLELISPQAKRIYQAMSYDDMMSWILVVQKAIEYALERRISFNTLSPNSDHFADKDRVRKELLKDASNETCADCGTKDPEWCSINLGVLLCISCSGIHRSLGTHISKVRSMTLDTASWTPELIAVVRSLGNSAVNAIFEYRLVDGVDKPGPTTSREEKGKYINNKYIARLMVEPRDESIIPVKALVQAAHRDDLTGALRAMAWGADMNGLLDGDVEPVEEAEVASDEPPQTPISYLSGDPDVDKWLTEDVPAVPARLNGVNALHVAVRDGYAAMAEFLIQNGADLNASDKRGNTPLHHAAVREDAAAISYLISKGARPDLKNADGQRPVDLAAEASPQIIALLSQSPPS